ncbi:MULTISPECIES: TetR family transcriptional regulator [unclassified Providencia]|uniref:TetR family transcriptional regulator n=1 Tax=unclassified Providencia TaxID=2633465 RepID=UPI002349D72E|nr:MULTISPECIES: TetR family transcriptional regulator [unclassified Providencia]MCL0002456.1 TetR family transcriptional regulator [Providencia rettgeri]MCL0015470.1 TetR family transcriptional regulator [Providencia rettgeri]
MRTYDKQQYKHKLTGSSINNFKRNKKRKVSKADKIFMCVGILFFLYLFAVAIK